MSRRRSCMHYWWLTLNLWIQIYDRVFDLHFLSAQLAGVYLGANLLITVTLKGLRCRLEWTDRRRTPPEKHLPAKRSLLDHPGLNSSRHLFMKIIFIPSVRGSGLRKCEGLASRTNTVTSCAIYESDRKENTRIFCFTI